MATKITIGTKTLTYTASTKTTYDTTVELSDGTVLHLPVKTLTQAIIKAAYAIAVTPAPPTTTGSTTVGGNPNLTIDGKTATGGVIIVKPGTYQNIVIQNLNNQNVELWGVLITGILHIGALTGCTLKNVTIQNTPNQAIIIDSRLVNVTLDSFTLNNCGVRPAGAFQSAIQTGYKVNWDGTDNTAQLLNLTISNWKVNLCGTLDFGGNNWQVAPYNMVKGLEIANCTFTNMDNLNVIDSRAIEAFKIHDCTFTNINKTNRDDTRLIMVVGNGDVYNCTFTNICGHSAAINPISWSTSVRSVSKFYNNVTNNTYRYSQYEVQQFSGQLVKGQNQAGDVEITNSIANNINLEHYEFSGTFVDNYIGNPQDVTDLAVLTLENCTGSNWFPIPPKGKFCNMNEAKISSGNVYNY